MIGENIIKARQNKNMRAADLSRAIGITTAYMSEIEKNKKIPSLEIIQKIASALDTSVSELLGEIEPEKGIVIKELAPGIQIGQRASSNKDYSIEDLELAFKIIDLIRGKKEDQGT